MLDLGAQMTQVANQTRIFGLVPSARSRLEYGVYGGLFHGGGGGVGAFDDYLGALGLGRGVLVSVALIGLAALRHALGRSRGVADGVRGAPVNEMEPV